MIKLQKGSCENIKSQLKIRKGIPNLRKYDTEMAQNDIENAEDSAENQS